MEVKDIIKEASIINTEANFKEAVEKMIADKTNSLLVIDTEEKLVGEITISELLAAVVPDYLSGDDISAHFIDNEQFEESVKDAAEKQVEYFMSKKIAPVKLDEELMVIAVKAIANKTVRIPVVDEDGKPIGIISRRGLKHIIADALGIADSE